MHLPPASSLIGILLALCIGLANGRVTRQTIKTLTDTTDELRERIVGVGVEDGLRGGAVGETGQSVFGAGRVVEGGDGEEVESVSFIFLSLEFGFEGGGGEQ